MTDETIFVLALEKSDPAERAAYLSEACGGDAVQRQRIEELLAAHGRAGDFLERPAIEPAADPERTRTEVAPGDPPDAEALRLLGLSGPPGALGRLAHYAVQGVAGRGGFGIVLKAFDEQLHRVVAIKVLDPRLALGGASRLRTAEHEAELAAECKAGLRPVTVTSYGDAKDPLYAASWVQYVKR